MALRPEKHTEQSFEAECSQGRGCATSNLDEQLGSNPRVQRGCGATNRTTVQAKSRGHRGADDGNRTRVFSLGSRFVALLVLFRCGGWWACQDSDSCSHDQQHSPSPPNCITHGVGCRGLSSVIWFLSLGAGVVAKALARQVRGFTLAVLLAGDAGLAADTAGRVLLGEPCADGPAGPAELAACSAGADRHGRLPEAHRS
jgi:hypothetical protein